MLRRRRPEDPLAQVSPSQVSPRFGGAVADALDARSRYADLLAGMREGPARDRLAALQSRVDAGVLAMCGAFRGLTEHRNLAFWEALGVERARPPLAGEPIDEQLPALPPPSEWEEILRDYYQLGLSTGRHPLALLRPRLRSLGVLRRRDLGAIVSGSRVCVSGLVTHLQHPQTAKGVIFASLEDETGINNIIFWPDVFEAERHNIIGTTLLIVYGQLQNEQGVIHVVAQCVEDYSHWVERLPRKSRDFH